MQAAAVRPPMDAHADPVDFKPSAGSPNPGLISWCRPGPLVPESVTVPSTPGLALPGWGLPPYRSGRIVAYVAAFLLLPFLALLLGSILFTLLSVETALDGTRTVRTLPGWLPLVANLLSLPLVVLLPVWMARSYRNVQALRGESIPGSPRWAAGAWFIPVLGGLFAIPSLRRMWSAGPGRHRYLPTLWGLSWSLYQLAVLAATAYGLALLGPGLASAADLAERTMRLDEVAVDLLPIQVGAQAILLCGGLAMVLSLLLFTRWEEGETLRRLE